MPEPWLLRPYREGDEGAILDLFARVFGIKRSLQHWRWQFLDNPCGRLFIHLAVAPSGRLVGQYAGLPVRMQWDGQERLFVQAVDVMADPEFRGDRSLSGVFGELLACYIRECLGPDGAAVGFGFPPLGHLRLGRQQGYVRLHRVEQLVKPLEAVSPSRWFRPITGWTWVVEEVSAVDGRADRLWERCRPELRLAAIRDARYLNWRYTRHPEIRYRFFAVKRRFSEAWAGLAVLRVGGEKATAYLGQGEPVASLVDWLVPLSERAVAEALVRRCESAGREAGMTALYAWCRPGSAHWRIFAERGFRSEPTPMYLTAVPGIDGISVQEAGERWYYTMGDSDLY